MNSFFNVRCIFVSGLIATLYVGCGETKEKRTESSDNQANTSSLDLVDPLVEQVRVVTKSENLLQALSGEMKQLANLLMDDATNDPDFVSPEMKYLGLTDGDFELMFEKAIAEKPGLPTATFGWPVSTKANGSSLGDIFQPIPGSEELKEVQIGTVNATFVSDKIVRMKTKLEGQANSGSIAYGLKGQQTLTWKNDNGWKLIEWRQDKLDIVASRGLFFQNVTDLAVPETATRQRLQSSSHQDLIRKNARDGSLGILFKPARDDFKHFSDWYSSYQYPSVSVVDIDQDGHDDLFITDRWQPAQFLRNKGDGTYEDWTKESGLEINELANCAYFADFDNDGDSDAFIGISMGPSRFFKNENGKFVPDEANSKVVADSRFVVAASVVDINRDGMLDLYLSTYAFGTGQAVDWYSKVTRDKDQLKTLVRFSKQHTYIDRAGPPNIVLMNRGGDFEWVKIDDTVKQFRDTYQSSWMDFDGDGDFDVYLCNDFAPDVFLENETERGSFRPTFTDSTRKFIGDPVMNFSMGASWGDYDNDGDLDLYVSNMYSKAGMRICSQIDSVDQRLKVSALGNFLYLNDGKKLQQLAGTDDADQHVAIVGWSFGGQFADFDNDGNLDIYVPSGFYSPPKELATDKDL